MRKQRQFPFAAISLKRSCIRLQASALVALVFLSLTFSACSTIRLQVNQITKKESVLPRDMTSPDESYEILKESACIITVNDEGNYFINKDRIAKEQLTEKIVEKLKDQTPDKQIVYIESAAKIQYETVVLLLLQVRRAKIDKAGLIVDKVNKREAGAVPTMFEINIPAEPNERETIRRPNPLTLVVEINKTGDLLLNNESLGTLSNTYGLTDKLAQVFKDRENNGVFREGTNEVEKTVIVKAPRSINYGDVVKAIDSVKIAGSQPIVLQIDDLSN